MGGGYKSPLIKYCIYPKSLALQTFHQLDIKISNASIFFVFDLRPKFMWYFNIFHKNIEYRPAKHKRYKLKRGNQDQGYSVGYLNQQCTVGYLADV